MDLFARRLVGMPGPNTCPAPCHPARQVAKYPAILQTRLADYTYDAAHCRDKHYLRGHGKNRSQ
jgi:hypothetical protein